MRIISPNRPVMASDERRQIWYKPFCRYIVSDYEAAYLQRYCQATTTWTESSFNPFERRYGGQDLTGKKVCIYRHTAYGDQLMISAVPRYLKTLYPTATVHLYCDPMILDMWNGNPFLDNSALPIPIPFDVATAYDYHIFYEGMLENNGEPDQNCCYDDFFGVIGLNGVPPQYKRPFIVPLPGDYLWTQREKIDLGGKYMVYHVSPANKNRAYPPDQGQEFIGMFLDHPEFQDWRVLLVGKKEHGIEYKIDDKRVSNLVGRTHSFRDNIPIMEMASLFVGPDSSFLHLAACFPHVVSVSLWGLFHPNDRAKYYPNHHPLFRPEFCKFAPCHNHEFSLPSEKCTQAPFWKDGQQYCAALAAIKPSDIMDKIEEVLL